MFRLLNKQARAPLPVVHREIRRYERTASTAVDDYEFNRNCIAILHQHDWRKGDYLRELRRRAAGARKVQQAMRKRPFAV